MPSSDSTLVAPTAIAAEQDFARRFLASLGVRSPTPGLVELTAGRLCLREERASTERDEWGNWDLKPSDSRANEALVPVIDRAIAAEGVRRPRWPDGKRFALCLTHDVDSVSDGVGRSEYVWRALGALSADPRSWRRVGSTLARTLRPSRGDAADSLASFERWIDAEARFGFRSTFFVFAPRRRDRHWTDAHYDWQDTTRYRGQSMRVGEMFGAIAAEGWEIGLHGSYGSARSLDRLKSERGMLELGLGSPVTSARQHYLNFDSVRSPAIMERAGIRIDSTLGYNRIVGYRAGTTFPFPLWNAAAEAATDVLEIPLIAMDCSLLESGALGLSVEDATGVVRRMMDDAEASGGCITLNWHPDHLARDGYFELYEVVLSEAASRGAWGCASGELAAWWQAQSGILQ